MLAERAAEIIAANAAAAAAAVSSSSLVPLSSLSSSSAAAVDHGGSNGDSVAVDTPLLPSPSPPSLDESDIATSTRVSEKVQEGDEPGLAPGPGLGLAPGPGLGLGSDDSDKPPLIVSWGLLAQSLKRGEEDEGKGQRRTARRPRDRRTRLSLIAQTQGLGSELGPGLSLTGREGTGERAGEGKEMTELLSFDSEDGGDDMAGNDGDSDGDSEDDDEGDGFYSDENDDEDEDEDEELEQGLGPELSTDVAPVNLTLPLLQEPHSHPHLSPTFSSTGGQTRARSSLDSKNTRARLSPKKRSLSSGLVSSGNGNGSEKTTLLTAAAREREYQGFHLIAPDLYVPANDPCLLLNEIAVLAFIQVGLTQHNTTQHNETQHNTTQ